MLLFKQLKKLFWQKQKYSEKVHVLGYRMMYIPFLTVVCVGFENGLKKWYQSTATGIKVLHLPTGFHAIAINRTIEEHTCRKIMFLEIA